MEISRRQHPQETTIEDLPEDVILCIVSKLRLRDVLSFSSVSKRWIHLPSSLENIELDISNMSKDGIQPFPDGDDALFRGVTQFLEHYNKLRSLDATPVSLSELCISFYLGRESSDHLDTWISLAMRNDVTSLVVSLECEHHQKARGNKPRDEKYIFPWQMLDKPTIVLKRLYLRSCIFECHLTSVWTSLEKLWLCNTDLTQHDVDRIFHCFPNIKIIDLRCCKVPAKLTFVGGSLYSLTVSYCTNVEEIEVIDSRALREFRYKGFSAGLNLVNPHQLTNLTFAIVDSEGADYIFQNLRRDFPAMRSLAIFSDRKNPPPLEHLHGRMYSFLQLEELKLYSNPECGFSLQTIGEMLKACPVLRRLEMVPSCKVDVSGDNRVRNPHKCLELIKIYGFCGSPGNVELAKFLIQVSEALVHLIIKRKVDMCCYRYSDHSLSWHGQEEPEIIKETLRKLMKGGELVFCCKI